MKLSVASEPGDDPVAAVVMDRHERAAAMVQALSPRELEQLNALLRKVMLSLEA